MVRPTKKRKSKLLFIILGFLVIIIGLISIFLKSGFFNIKYTEILGNNLICADKDQITSSIDVQGQSLLFLDRNKVSNNILKKFICIKSASVLQIFPDKVKVELVGRIPDAMLFTLKNSEATTAGLLEEIATPSAKAGMDAYLMDQEGVVFAKTSERLDIPNVFLDEDIMPGKKLDGNRGEKIFKVLVKIREFGLDNTTSQIYNNFLIVFSLPKIIFNLNEDINAQIASLQLILKIAKIDHINLEFIDLRFDKPIVKFAPQKK
ncbi:FtsQ-type POTRA domain-containing protein [Candidatus Daviesbacteria bacterium]|nr:FtsQ-type POTRA domain-containing protein [Candidatus Daviesbacteria bacterium]